MDISRILRARMATTRSSFAEQSLREPDKSSIKYTFVGYGPGNTCTIRSSSGKVLNATLQTNGHISSGQDVCVIESGNELIVKMMETPPEPEPEQPDTTERLKIKILWTVGSQLWMGGDRSRPKLIHSFPNGAKIRGLCHNHGEGDRYCIGVIVAIGEAYEQWIFTGMPSGVHTAKLTDFKSSRIQPIGNGYFVDPWLPPNMLDGKFIGYSKEKKLILFGNKQPYTIAATGDVKSAKVVRKKGSDFHVVVEVGAQKTKHESSVFTEAKKMPWKDWAFLLFDDLALDRDGSAFKDKNLTGTSIVSSSRKTRSLKLKPWKSLKALFEQMGALWTRNENSWGTTVQFHVAKGQFDAAAIADIKIEMRRTVGQRPIGSGDDNPPPGDDPANPYKDRYFSFVWGKTADADAQTNPFWAPNNVWSVRDGFGDVNPGFANYPSNPPNYSGVEPHWRMEGVYLGLMPLSQYLGIINSYRFAHNSMPQIPLETVRTLLPPWLSEDAFDSFYRYDTASFQPGDLCYPVFRYMDKTGAERYSGNHWNNYYNEFRVMKWRGYYFLGDPDRDSQPPDTEPNYEPWEVELYQWRDPIVCSKDGRSVLVKQWIESAVKGNPPAPPMAYKAQQIVLMKGTKETNIQGSLPLLCAEDTLIENKLYRVDRSSLEPSDSPGGSARSRTRKLPVETYLLSQQTKVSTKTEKIYPIPENAVILSASYYP